MSDSVLDKIELGMSLRDAGRTEEAADLLGSAITRESAGKARRHVQVWAWKELAWTHAMAGDPEKATHALAQALDILPDSPVLLLDRAFLEEAREDPAAARESYEAALAKLPPSRSDLSEAARATGRDRGSRRRGGRGGFDEGTGRRWGTVESEGSTRD